MWNRKRNQVRMAEGGRETRSSRRGVLLLVVLSMLVLFMLVGTAFLMSSNQSRVAMKKVALQDRLGNYATRLLDRAVFQIVRDTDNPSSVIRYHSLLRDLYGTDGFQGVVYKPGTVDLTLLRGQAPRFAGAIADDTATAVREDLGPTNGQFIDIYVLTKPYTPIDYSTRYNGLANPLDLRCVLKLERNPYGELQPYPLPLTKGYFNGCLLTMTSGPASGQSTRILDYEYMGELTAAVPNKFTAERLFRFRVMAIQRTDGQSLQPDPSAAAKARSPELADLAAQSFVVNGRAFSGTGVGYNPLAATGQPRLSALQLYPYPLGTAGTTTYIGAELALLPNAAYFNPLVTPVGAAPFTVPNPDASKPPILLDPFLMPLPAPPSSAPPIPTGQFQRLNDPTVVAASGPYFNYPTYAGPGGPNESYDAPDFQNIGLASLTVKPRSQARVVTDQPPYYHSMEDFLADPGSKGKFLRLDLEDVPLPSFHRPDLVNYWYHRLVRYLKDLRGMDEHDAVRAILRPYEDDKFKINSIVSQLTPGDAALISAIKRQIMLRPTNEDHPHFDGGNPLSVQPINPMVANNLVSTDKMQITLPYWAACGPWDVDNDNDGVRDSIWVDLGDPIQETEDGRRYKPLYAFLCIDLDSRLNVNAHGLVDDILPPLDSAGKNIDPARTPFFDTTFVTDLAGTPGNLAHTPTTVRSTLQLPRGVGYGPAEISLRPVFRAPLNSSFQPTFGNQDESGPVDSYATLLAGRKDANGKAISGRNGFYANSNFFEEAEAGTNYRYLPIVTSGPGAEPAGSPRWYTGEQAAPDLAAQLKFFDYPWASTQPSALTFPPTYPLSYPPTYPATSAFGTAPDLKGRYALGLDYTGQPVYEVANDVNPNTAALTPDKWLRFNLLANTPYEMDLSSPQRRDSWASRTNSFGSMVDPVTTFQTSLGQNDDAPFSPTDLEKVLRGWDLDASTLPSRLWDVVDSFDPYKLCWFDPYRVASYANDLFDPTARSITAITPYQTPSPQLLTAAQELAGISRRSVTTESFSLPVATEDFRKKLIYGADGLPGLPGVDDDKAGGVDDARELNTVPFMNGTVMTGTDDYGVVMQEVRNRTGSTFGLTTPNNPRILDYLRYRIVLELLRRNVIKSVAMTDEQIDAGINNIIYAGGLLSPETVSGLRMDLNRPFGDGQDNNGDGVVDDPLEAGEPFVDDNANGRWDVTDTYIDFDGNKAYTAPVDQLWSTLTANGAIGERVAFDYSNGQVVPVYRSSIRGGVRNLESQGRQLYARQLYCLMLLLTDENYIAPWDPNDAQLITWMDAEKKKLTAAPMSMPPPLADFLVKRKMTCRMIAQWAINCADMRDSDAIQTPFEYDENPWDGWGVLEQDGNLIPIDGDVATDENKGEMIHWGMVPQGRDTASAVDDFSKVIAPTPASTTPSLPAVPSLVPTAKLPTLDNQTRGVVWGAERPDLLITETLAFHDRRTENMVSNDSNGHGAMDHYASPGESHYPDADPDQSLRPRGMLMVEVQNPWSPDGQYPAEIYSRVNSSLLPTDPNWLTKSQGVELGRVSNYAWDEVKGRLTVEKTDAVNGIKRSPVWKLAVVEEWPDSRNDDEEDQKRLDRVLAPAPYEEPKPYIDLAAKVKAWKPTATEPNPPFRPTDLDFDAAFDAGFLPKQKAVGQNLFEMKYPYVEREFYFTTDKSPEVKLLKPTDLERVINYDFSAASFKLRIPYRGVTIQYPTSTKQNPKVFQTQKFIPWGLELSSLTEPVIAPIMPGRYGVIGSAGANYNLTTVDPKDEKDPNKQVYISTTGRKADTALWNTADGAHYPLATRRVEMRPSNDPTMQQLVIGSNGGDPKDEHQPSLAGNTQYDATTPEIGRDNELINNQGTVENLTVPDVNGKPKYYQPSVAIPVEGMNISEPAWGYSLSEVESAVFEGLKKMPPTPPTLLAFKKEPLLSTKNYEGRYYGASGGNPSSYDKPFDGYPGHKTAPELLRNGTTANYRTIHLQRLANPMLPWNPAPGSFKDSAGQDMYRANMPINPYRTVDTSSVNLTAFNGVSDAEANYPSAALPNAQADLLQKRPWDMTDVAEMIKPGGTFTTGKQVWYFRSTERGAWSRLNVLGSNPTAPATATSPPQRVLWTQEPAMVRFKKPQAIGVVGEVYDLIPSRQVTMRVDEVPSSIKATTSQNIQKNRVDMVMENTLGFGNRSFGLLYDKEGAKLPGTPAAASTSSSAPPAPAAIGAPAPGDFVWDNNGDKPAAEANLVRLPVTSTNPWLAWDNRPYVSPEELLKVPGASQSQMLRQYATIDPSLPAANRANPYGLTMMGQKLSVQNPTPIKNEVRWVVMQAPFGDLTNVFANTAEQLTVFQGILFVPSVADVVRNATTGLPQLFDNKTDVADPTNLLGEVRPYGAPNFNRILEYVQVPSRYVGTDTLLNAETFNDDRTLTSGPANPYEDIFALIPGAPLPAVPVPTLDPRYYFQPPFNKVSRERDPGRVNLNTVTGRRTPVSGGAALIWSEVYDGIMHRFHDGNLMTSQSQLGHFGPAWRDVVLSRRGYAQYNADPTILPDGSKLPVERLSGTPDVFESGLNPLFPTIFANPFRSPDAGDLVPLQQMMQYGVDASMLRKHPYDRAIDPTTKARLPWGPISPLPKPFGDARDAGFGASETVSTRSSSGAIPNDNVSTTLVPPLPYRDTLPLFSEAREQPFADTDRNPYMMYEPMSRLGNLVTNRSGVYAVWITVGYFEVEKAPDWNDPDPETRANIRAHFGGTTSDADPITVAALQLYNRAYPDGYMLGKELGSETGDVKRPRGFYIIDRTEEVGFKPGEDLNVEKTIRLRRRIE